MEHKISRIYRSHISQGFPSMAVVFVSLNVGFKQFSIIAYKRSILYFKQWRKKNSSNVDSISVQ